MLDPDRGYRGARVDGLDFFVDHMTWKQLPRELFEAFGGYTMAKQLRLERGYGKVISASTSKAIKDGDGVGGGSSSGGGGGGRGSRSGSTSDVKNEMITSPNLLNTTSTTNSSNAGNGDSSDVVNGNDKLKNMSSSISKDSKKGISTINKYGGNDNNSSKSITNTNGSGSIIKRINYDIGKRSFPSDMYEGIGSNEVDTIESVRKKLNLDAFATTYDDNKKDGGAKSSAINNGKVNNRYANKGFLASKLLYQHPLLSYDKSLKSTQNQHYNIPHVTWQLLDNK